MAKVMVADDAYSELQVIETRSRARGVGDPTTGNVPPRHARHGRHFRPDDDPGRGGPIAQPGLARIELDRAAARLATLARGGV